MLWRWRGFGNCGRFSGGGAQEIFDRQWGSLLDQLTQMQRHPSLSAAVGLLAERQGGALAADENQAIQGSLKAALKPLQRYRCAACGFETQQYFWQCPGCQGWDTYPPQRLEDL